MNKTTTGVVVAVVGLLIVGGLVFAVTKSDGDPSTQDHSAHDQNQPSNLNNSTNPADESSNSESQQTNSVEIKDYAYSPAKIQVKKGTKVTWTNQDDVRHDVKPDEESSDFEASELLGKGESYSYTFNTVGTYTYHCSPHPYMKGRVEVVE